VSHAVQQRFSLAVALGDGPRLSVTLSSEGEARSSRPSPARRTSTGNEYDQRAATKGKMVHMTSTNAPVRTSTVLIYSDDPQVRHRMRLAIGTRPAADVTVAFVEVATHDEVFRQVQRGGVDLLLLDGEATPAGGLGIARQIRDEIHDAPLTCVVIARAADRWLAAYAQVDATLTHPLDPMTTAQTVAGLLRERSGGAA
jgi:CheY-like chemotaxis protein